MASSTTTSTSVATSRTLGISSARGATRKCSLISTSTTGRCFPRSSAACSGSLSGTVATRRAVVARDRLGIKPLYYARRDDLLVFASELKSLLASGLVDPELDYNAIDAYLTFGFFPGPVTPLTGVSKLMPGHVLVVEDGQVRTEQFWRYPVPNVGERLSEEEYEELVSAKLDESVRLRLMSDVPLGAMLSGGLDSSLIVALMARHMKEPVKTFAVGFVESGPQNELADARLVAKALGTEHHELELSFTDDTVDLEDLVWYLDEPLADLSSLGFLALCELAARYVTVAPVGPRCRRALWRVSQAPSGGARGAMEKGAAGRSARGDVDRAARSRALPASRRDPGRARSGRSPRFHERADGRRPPAAARARSACGTGWQGRPRCRPRPARRCADDPLPATLHIDGQLALVDDMLHYFDRTSMAHSLEVRVPFLDHEFVELAATIPADLKIRGRTTKYLLKNAARGVVPDHVIDKPKIGFFAGTVTRWFEAQAKRSIPMYLLDSDPHYGPFLDPQEVRRLVERHGSQSQTFRLAAPALDPHARGVARNVHSAGDGAGEGGCRASGCHAPVTAPSYAAITPARNEADNLPRLAACLAAQTHAPLAWLIVDNGSTDDTLAVARRLGEDHAWIHVLSVPGGDGGPVRGAPIVRALHEAIETLRNAVPPSFVVSLDADVSFDPDYLHQLLDRFAENETLGIASGSCYELVRRRVAAASRHGQHGLGRVTDVPMGVPRGRASTRGALRLGRDRRDQGQCSWVDRRRHSSSSRSATTGRKACGTAAGSRRVPPRVTPPTTWATGRGTSSCVRFAMSFASQAHSVSSGATRRRQYPARAGAPTSPPAPTYDGSRACDCSPCACARRSPGVASSLAEAASLHSSGFVSEGRRPDGEDDEQEERDLNERERVVGQHADCDTPTTLG